MDLPTFKLRAAAVHAAPVYMDKEKTTAKVVQLIEEAGKQDLQLLVFPEVFIPGYPVRESLANGLQQIPDINSPSIRSTSSKPTLL